MFFRARRALRRAWFDLNCRSLLRTSPIQTNDTSLTLVSMVCHGEVLMYLLAAKSFCRELGRTPQVVILDDGSLTKSDYATLLAHIPSVKIVHISEVAPANIRGRLTTVQQIMIITGLTAAFHKCNHRSLASRLGCSVTLSANKCFVHFHRAAQFRFCPMIRSHGETDAMRHKPCSLVGDAKHPVKLVGTNGLL